VTLKEFNDWSEIKKNGVLKYLLTRLKVKNILITLLLLYLYDFLSKSSTWNLKKMITFIVFYISTLVIGSIFDWIYHNKKYKEFEVNYAKDSN